jgi:hypothetical protein
MKDLFDVACWVEDVKNQLVPDNFQPNKIEYIGEDMEEWLAPARDDLDRWLDFDELGESYQVFNEVLTKVQFSSMMIALLNVQWSAFEETRALKDELKNIYKGIVSSGEKMIHLLSQLERFSRGDGLKETPEFNLDSTRRICFELSVLLAEVKKAQPDFGTHINNAIGKGIKGGNDEDIPTKVRHVLSVLINDTDIEFDHKVRHALTKLLSQAIYNSGLDDGTEKLLPDLPIDAVDYQVKKLCPSRYVKSNPPKT